jgi:succinyl-diaminopimelate desuccinylase
VPDKATALITCTGEHFNQLIEESKGCEGCFVIEKTLSGAAINSTGVAAHAMHPQSGKNAAVYLFDLLSKVFPNKDLGTFITFLNEKIGLELDGTSLGIQQSDEQSGDLSVNVGLVRFAYDSASVGLDIRYPVTSDGNQIISAIESCAKNVGLTMKVVTHNPPLYLPEESPFISLLQDSYEAVTGQKASLYSTGGGTYARELNGKGVAFGPFFENEPDRRLHNADENIDINQFMVHAQICLEAMYRMFTE